MKDLATILIEKEGQSDFIQSDLMPIDGDWDSFAKLGAKRGKQVDDLFYNCTLPPGWTKERSSDSSYGSYLLVNQGCRRGYIFYKAVFYDRCAHFGLYRRFNVKRNYSDDFYSDIIVFSVEDMKRHYSFSSLGQYCFYGNQLGLWHDQSFYPESSITGKYSSAQFEVREQVNPVDISVLSNEIFFSQYHNKKTSHYGLINATENLLRNECEDWLRQKGFHDWNSPCTYWDLP